MFGFESYPCLYDEEADALYVRLGASPVVRQVSVTPDIIADIAEDGEIVGVEVLSPREHAGQAARWLVRQGIPLV
ncbi:MAG: DUF2283 domain-containing protein [Firmicutes bacterium]|nr:DUF2283 domain-containing protein [Bacillota bacterium]